MGVWIEISFKLAYIKEDGVTPFVGVWIEISNCEEMSIVCPSLPSWECGLKYCCCDKTKIKDIVTPFVGVWIEMYCFN